MIFLVVVMISFYRSFGDEADALYYENSDNTALPDLKIWRSYSHDSTDDDTTFIALIAEDSVQTQQIATDLARQGYNIHQTNDVDAMLETVQTRPVDWEFMIFDLDLLDDLESNVDDLIMFRETCARIPILLLSGSTNRDEFSDHRRAIGDATLRKPVFRSRRRGKIHIRDELLQRQSTCSLSANAFGSDGVFHQYRWFSPVTQTLVFDRPPYPATNQPLGGAKTSEQNQGSSGRYGGGCP